jgi:hypothetical protein
LLAAKFQPNIFLPARILELTANLHSLKAIGNLICNHPVVVPFVTHDALALSAFILKGPYGGYEALTNELALATNPASPLFASEVGKMPT